MAEPKVYAKGISLKTKRVSGSSGEFSILQLGIKWDEFKEQVEGYVKPSGWLNLDILKRQNPDEKGSHYMTINTYGLVMDNLAGTKKSDASDPDERGLYGNGGAEDDGLPF